VVPQSDQSIDPNINTIDRQYRQIAIIQSPTRISKADRAIGAIAKDRLTIATVSNNDDVETRCDGMALPRASKYPNTARDIGEPASGKTQS